MSNYFSLVAATVNRKIEFESLCISLANQTYKEFELIVIDQNETDLLEEIINKFKNMINIVYIKSNKKGLSLNRNIGLKFAKGDIIAFPDDDCEYKPDTLEFVNKSFINNNYDMFIINYEDKNTGVCHFKEIHKIEFNNILRSGISFCIFVKRHILGDTQFDERLGCGSKFGAGEESDMIARLLQKKINAMYYGFYTIFHSKSIDRTNLIRSYNYALGFGAIHKKFIFKYKKPYYIFNYILRIVRNIIAIIISPYKKYYIAALKGKLYGFIQYNTNH